MKLSELIRRRKKRYISLQQMRQQNERDPDDVYQKIALLTDSGTFEEMNGRLIGGNPLDFPGYLLKLKDCRKKTDMEEAVVTGTARINGIRTAIAMMDKRFLMGSMGTAVGEKIVSLAEYAMKEKLPLIIFTASGGARMQEGLYSLMQMARTSAAIEKYKTAGGFYISCLMNPTTGGVSASFASLGDIMIAEPGALICFAGPRVIEQTIGQKLPDGFQKAEFLLEHGMLDAVVEPEKMKKMLDRFLRLHGYGSRKKKEVIR